MATSLDCSDCEVPMELCEVDCYRCPKCGKVIDMCEEEDL